jgi:hypothetical protein
MRKLIQSDTLGRPVVGARSLSFKDRWVPAHGLASAVVLPAESPGAKAMVTQIADSGQELREQRLRLTIPSKYPGCLSDRWFRTGGDFREASRQLG